MRARQLSGIPDIEIQLVLDALLAIARTPLPLDLDNLPTLEAALADPFRGWTRLRRDSPDKCDPWVLRNLDTLEQPPPPGLPTLRAFQQKQGEAVIQWLRERL